MLTIDAGGSSAKASVASTSGEVLAVTAREYLSTHPAPNFAEWDPETWWPVIVRAAGDAVSAAGRPAAHYVGVTCTAMRIPFVLLDAQCHALAPGVLNVDRRGADYLGELTGALGDERLYRLTGHWAAPEFGLPKLLWFVHRAPAIWSRVRHVLQMHDWMLFQLCGEMASEPSSAAMSQAVDIANRGWAIPLLEALGIEPELFPPMRDAGRPLGGLSEDVARAIGLPGGLPVHVGGGDTHFASLGVGGATGGSVVVVGGSTTPLIATVEGFPVPTPAMDGQPLVSPHLRPGRWALETNTGPSGSLYKWLRELAGRSGQEGYEQLDRLAEEAPVGSEGLLAIGPSPSWNQAAWEHRPPAALYGIGPQHVLAHAARAIMEAACYAIAENLETLDASAQQTSGQVLLAGGMARSRVWSQMLADVVGRPIRLASVAEPAGLAGVALVTGSEPPSAGPAKTRSPDGDRHRAYAENRARYVEVYGILTGEVRGT